MGLFDRMRKRPTHDEASIRQMLEEAGAGAEQAQQIVSTLARRLSPDEMHVWLCHPDKSHPIPDPESAKRMQEAGLVGAPTNWTPINAVSSGRTELVIEEARRFAAA